MANFKSVRSTNITGDNVVAKSLSATEYKNLPSASTQKSGVVKIDGTSIVLNSNGTISARLQSTGVNADMNEHMQDLNIHVSNEDRRNLNNLDNHFNNKTLHFQNGERERIYQTLEDILARLDKSGGGNGGGLSQEDINNIANHINSKVLHFDNGEQKQSIINMITNHVALKQSKAGKILITGDDRNVRLSQTDARVLEYIANLNRPIEEMLDSLANKDHTHEDLIQDYSWHFDDGEIHLSPGERSDIYDRMDNISTDVEDVSTSILRTERLMVLNNPTNRKIKARYIKHTLFVRQDIDEEGEEVMAKSSVNLDWVNLDIYVDGENVAPKIPASKVETDMLWSDQVILKWLDGNTTDIVHTQPCSCNELHHVTVDLGSVRDDISHIRIYNGINGVYDTIVEVSEDGEEWTELYNSILQGTYTEDKYGKIHILNYEAYTDFLTCKSMV